MLKFRGEKCVCKQEVWGCMQSEDVDLWDFPHLNKAFRVCVCVFVGSYTLILSVRTEYQNTHFTSSEDVWLVLTTSEACLRLSFKVGVKVGS